MTDIYIKRNLDGRRRSHRPLIGIVIALLVAGAIILTVRHVRGRNEEDDARSVEEQLQAAGLLSTPDTADEAPSRPVEPRPTPASSRPAATPTPPPASPAPTPTATTRPAPRVVARLAELQTLADGGDYLQAREQGLALLAELSDSASLAAVKDVLTRINRELVFSKRILPNKLEVVVASGDTMAEIAKAHGTNFELIQAMNGISGHMIRVGQRLRVLKATFRVVVDVSDNTCDVYMDDAFLLRYRVGTGAEDRTPRGDFAMVDRIKHPTWWRDDGKAIPYGTEENELGTHWLALNTPGIGLHGTWKPASIGRHESNGCIRMLNEEIEELYQLLPLGTPVRIVD